ncbi:Uncharacterised protein [Achromobacter sp. 2789STDY5608633]|nr:Uncharacterised protein [Achromobacter sp. 2789STDY5608633]
MNRSSRLSALESHLEPCHGVHLRNRGMSTVPDEIQRGIQICVASLPGGTCLDPFIVWPREPLSISKTSACQPIGGTRPLGINTGLRHAGVKRGALQN